jgi:hypothetical protein
MSNTFKYLDANKQKSTDDSAQDFLNKKMADNKYMSVSNPDNPYSMGEGTIPKEAAYEPNPSSSSDKSSGSLGGSRTPEQLRKEFGLIYDENNAPQFDPNANKGKMQTDDGHMWYKDSAGQTQYLGQVAGEYERGSIGDGKATSEAKMKGSDKSMFHGGGSGKDHKSSNDLLQQAHDERNGAGHSNGFNSINDVANAMRHMLSSENSTAATKEAEPIEHSPEIKQAKERVQSYEQDVLSGKVSDDVYAGNTSDKYNLDLNKGADGIGSFIPNTAEQATASFLDNKKSQIKDKYQFNRA